MVGTPIWGNESEEDPPVATNPRAFVASDGLYNVLLIELVSGLKTLGFTTDAPPVKTAEVSLDGLLTVFLTDLNAFLKNPTLEASPT